MFMPFWGGDHHAITRLKPDGSLSNIAAAGNTIAGGYYGTSPYSSGTYYPVSFALDDQSSRLAFTSVYRWGLSVLRPLEATDPNVTYDSKLYDRGRELTLFGTLPEWGRLDTRPALSALHGVKGHNWLGNTATFDDMALTMSDAELGSYIRDGMDSGVPRPEITGRDLQSLIYFIRLSSLQGKAGPIDPAAIARALKTAGYWDDLDAPLPSPEIRSPRVEKLTTTSFRISWQTDQVATGIVEYGSSDYYGLRTAVLPAGKTFSVTLTDVTPNFHARIQMKNKGGKQTITGNLRPEGTVEDKTPPVISNVRAANVQATKAQILWETDEVSDARVEYGVTTAYGSVTSDFNHVTSHSVSLAGIIPETTYHFRVRSVDPSRNASMSGDATFTTPKAPPNQGPTVDAGGDQVINLPASATLNTTVTDDGLPIPPGKLTFAWSKDSGRGTVTFGSATSDDTTASFSDPGTYVLRLTANDGVLSASDDVQVIARPEGPKGLIGEWRFEGNFDDSSGEANHGTAKGGATLASGKRGQGAKLDGIDDEISIGTRLGALARRELTLAGWMVADKVDGTRLIIGSDGSSNANMNFGPGTYGFPRILVGQYTVLVRGATAIKTGTWYHVVATRSGTIGDWTIKAYLNGQEDASLKTTTNAGQGNAWHIGMANADSFFAGTLDDVCIWDRALSAEEIGKLWNGGNGTPCDQLNPPPPPPPPPPSPSDLCLQIESAFRKRTGRDQKFSKVRVRIYNQTNKALLLEKTYASAADGEVIIPETDLGTVPEPASGTTYLVSGKIHGHTGVAEKGVTQIRGRSGCLKLRSMVHSDMTGDGKASIADLVDLLRCRTKGACNEAELDTFLEGKNITIGDIVTAIRDVLGSKEDEECTTGGC